MAISSVTFFVNLTLSAASQQGTPGSKTPKPQNPIEVINDQN